MDERLKAIAMQVNSVSEGRLVGSYNATTAQPTSGIYARGDFVANSNPTEEGSAGAKYVVMGWKFIADGTASASSSVQVRALTGN